MAAAADLPTLSFKKLEFSSINIIQYLIRHIPRHVNRSAITYQKTITLSSRKLLRKLLIQMMINIG